MQLLVLMHCRLGCREQNRTDRSLSKAFCFVFHLPSRICVFPDLKASKIKKVENDDLDDIVESCQTKVLSIKYLYSLYHRRRNHRDPVFVSINEIMV